MTRFSKTGLLLLLAVAVCFAARSRAGEVIDRVAAKVNSEVVLESDVELAARFEALQEGRAYVPITPAARQTILERLIDQSLLMQQIRNSNFRRSNAQQIAAAIGDIRRKHPAGRDDASWQAALEAAGLNQNDVEEQVARQLDILRFVELRFRPGVHVDIADIENYYRDVYVPEMRARGAVERPLNDVSREIEDILTERSVSEQLNNWLKAMRSESDVHVITGDTSTRAESR